MKRSTPHEYKPDPSERYFDWFAAALLMFAMIAAALRLSATDWAGHLEITQSLVFMGVVIGMAVGKSIYSPRAAFLFCVDYGLILIPWQLGTMFYSIKIEWKDRFVNIAGRIAQVIQEISLREQVTDNMLFVTLMAILFYAISFYAGYALVRRAGVWQAVLPMGITILVIESFDHLLERRGWFLASYLFLVFFLVARVHFLLNTRRWRDSKTYIPADASYDQMRVALGVVLVVVLLAWNTPALAGSFPVLSSLYRNQVEPVRQRISDRLGFMFSSLQASVGLVSDYYGDQMILGSGSVHTNQLAMTVEAPNFVYSGQRFYWRARVYDLYQNGGWETSITNKQDYETNVTLSLPDSPDRQQVIFKFRPDQAIMTVYVAPQPMRVNRPGTLQGSLNPDGSLDVIALQAEPYILPGETYEVTASLPSFTQKELRAAGMDYPSWVMERYLQLPEEITPRTIELAQRLAEGQNTPFDVVESVTDYLRSNYEYVETLDDTPGRQEPVDWFLFDYKKGFCNYFATSEVLLLRAAGIPARWAVGYAQGERIEAEETQRGDVTEEEQIASYRVLNKDAHAWPEVYFPGIGWVEFEPTASQEPIFRPSGETIPLGPLDDEMPERPPNYIPPEDLPDPSEIVDETETSQTGFTVLSVALSLIGLGVGLGLLGLALFARQRKLPVWMKLEQAIRAPITPLPVRLERGLRRRGLRPPSFLTRWAHYELLPDLSKAYLEIDRALMRLGGKPVPSLTPAERAAALVEVLPGAQYAVQQLVVQYHLGTYSPYRADYLAAQRAGYEIRHKSWIELMKKILARLQEPIKRRFQTRGIYER